MVFEVVVPEGAIAVFSQLWAQRGRRFGNVTEALDSFDRNQILAVAFVVIWFMVFTHHLSVRALCIAPRDADGGGLLSFSAW